MNVSFSSFINKGERIAAAVSGGADSMALLNLLVEERENLDITVLAINIEHGIRGEESLKDTRFVEDYCKEKNIPLITFSVNAPEFAEKEGLSLEEAARVLRYECFYRAIKEGKCDKVATAHHASDNMESVLMNIFRGTSLKGLTGIKPDYNGKIIRPLLNLTKAEIEEYVRKNDIPFVTDSTNSDTGYTRNFIRLKVIPLIKQAFPKAESSVTRLTEILREDELYLSSRAEELLFPAENGIKLKIPAEKPVLKRAAVFAMQRMGIKKDWESKHLNDVFSLSLNIPGKSINLPGGVVALREYDDILFKKAQDRIPLNIPFKEGCFEYCGKTYCISRQPAKGADLKKGLFIAAEKVSSSAVIRSPENGDIFRKFGGGTKPLSDFFTDKKIPLEKRKQIPVIAQGKKILAVMGYAVSEDARADNKTETLYKLS